MGVVHVQKNGYIGFIAQALHDGGKLACTEEISLSFGGANKYRKPRSTRGRDNCFQLDEICDIEVAKRRSFLFKLRQDVSECIHNPVSSEDKQLQARLWG